MKDFFEVKRSKSDEQSWQIYYPKDYSSFWEPLTC